MAKAIRYSTSDNLPSLHLGLSGGSIAMWYVRKQYSDALSSWNEKVGE